jgi:hypothetical protein
MYCAKCGAELLEDARFCGSCGARAKDDPTPPPKEEWQQTPPEKDKPPERPFLQNKKLLIGIVCAVGVMAAAFLAFNIFMNTGRRYLATTLSKTVNAYRNEAEKFIKDNPVINTMKNSIANSYIQRLVLPGGAGTFSFADDKKNKIFRLQAESEFIANFPVEVGVFVTDDRLIAGITDNFNLEANPKALGTELLDLIENISESGYLDFDFTTDDLNEAVSLLDSIDLSYSGLTSGRFYKGDGDYKEIEKLLTEQAAALLAHAGYFKTNSDMEIGGKTVKTALVKLTIGPKELEAWFTDDLLPALRNNALIRKYWDAADDFDIPYSYGASIEYDDFLDETADSVYNLIDALEEEDMSFTLNAQIYKGVAVSLEGYLLTEYYEDEDEAPGFMISAVGDPYRLDEINVAIYDTRHRKNPEINISGDHFSNTRFTTTATVRMDSNTEKFSVDWDLTGDRNNVRLRMGDDSLRFTLAAQDDGITAEWEGLEWSLERYEGNISLPKDTVKANAFSIEDFIETIESLIR